MPAWPRYSAGAALCICGNGREEYAQVPLDRLQWLEAASASAASRRVACHLPQEIALARRRREVMEIVMAAAPETSGLRSTSEIASFHAHVYYDPATTRAEAEHLRTWIGERFSVTLGRCVKVGRTTRRRDCVCHGSFSDTRAVADAEPWQPEHSGASEHDQSAQGSSGGCALDWHPARRPCGQITGRGGAGRRAGAEHASDAPPLKGLG